MRVEMSRPMRGAGWQEEMGKGSKKKELMKLFAARTFNFIRSFLKGNLLLNKP